MDVYVLVLEIHSTVDDSHDRILAGCYDAIDVALNDAKKIASAYRVDHNHVRYMSIHSRKLGKLYLDRKPICEYYPDEDAVEWHEKECS